MIYSIIQMTATAGPFDQPNFSVHFRLFGLQSHELQVRFRVSRPQSSLDAMLKISIVILQ